MRMTNEGVMTDYSRSTKWRICRPHGHARDGTLDALAATPWLRNRSCALYVIKIIVSQAESMIELCTFIALLNSHGAYACFASL